MYSRIRYLFNGKQLAVAVAGGAAMLPSLSNCSDDHIPSLDYGWPHHGALASFDYAYSQRLSSLPPSMRIMP
jgi:hypothetical protein